MVGKRKLAEITLGKETTDVRVNSSVEELLWCVALIADSARKKLIRKHGMPAAAAERKVRAAFEAGMGLPEDAGVID